MPRDKDYGLYACSVLNPGEPIIDHLFYYYHNMIKVRGAPCLCVCVRR